MHRATTPTAIFATQHPGADNPDARLITGAAVLAD